MIVVWIIAVQVIAVLLWIPLGRAAKRGDG